jgi:hypothetical protein
MRAWLERATTRALIDERREGAGAELGLRKAQDPSWNAGRSVFARQLRDRTTAKRLSGVCSYRKGTAAMERLTEKDFAVRYVALTNVSFFGLCRHDWKVIDNQT